MIVSTEWVAEHLDDPGLVVAESDEDVLLYETGHIPGAVKLDWHTELNDPVTRDYVDGAGFARLMSDKGISRDTTLVLYGDRNNWWAAYALWVCSLFGHPDVRLIDGGRAKWIAEGRPVSTETPQRTPTDYPVVDRDDKRIRAFRDQVLAHLGQPMIDVRSPGEYTGDLLHMPDYPQEGALRGGHIPGARNVPWARAAAEDATFRTRAELEAIYRGEAGLRPTTTWWCTAASASAPATPGSCCSTCSATRTCATMTGHGPSGGTASGFRSPAGRTRDSRTLHPRLQEIVEDFAAVPDKDRLQLLLEYSQELPALPERYAEHRGLLEPVPECQTPLFLAVEVGPDRRSTCSSRPRRSADDPRLRRASCTPGWTGCPPTRCWPPRRVHRPARPARPGEPAPVARHGRDAGQDQAPDPREAGRLGSAGDLRWVRRRTASIASEPAPYPEEEEQHPITRDRFYAVRGAQRVLLVITGHEVLAGMLARVRRDRRGLVQAGGVGRHPTSAVLDLAERDSQPYLGDQGVVGDRSVWAWGWRP